MDVSEQLPAATDAWQVAPLPSLTVTVPVGVPLEGGAAVTLKDTVYGWPTTVVEGLMLVIAVRDCAFTTLNALLVASVSPDASARSV